MANKRYTLLQIKNKKSQNNFFYRIPDQGKYYNKDILFPHTKMMKYILIHTVM